MLNPNETGIVCTIGQRRDSAEIMLQMLHAGMSIERLTGVLSETRDRDGVRQ
jgi:hypothetical protein